MCEKCIREAAEKTEYASATVNAVNISYGDKGRGLSSPSLSAIQRGRLMKNKGDIFGKETPGNYYFWFKLFSCIIIPINMLFHSYSKTNSV